MSNPISNIKSSSGSINAQITNNDTVAAMKPFDTLANKLDGSFAKTRPETIAYETDYTYHENKFVENHSGKLLLQSATNYHVAEYDATPLRNKTLLLIGMHEYASQAFVIVDASDNVLIDDGINDNTRVAGVKGIYTIPYNAAKLYVSFGNAAHIPNMLRNRARKLRFVTGYAPLPDGNGIDMSIAKPDHIMYNTMISRSLQQSGTNILQLEDIQGYNVAIKHLRKNTYFRLDTVSRYNAAAAMICDENYVVKHVMSGAGDTDANGIRKCNIKMRAQFDCVIMWNYTAFDNLKIATSESFMPPYNKLYDKYIDFDYVTIPSPRPIWDASREGAYMYYKKEFVQFKGIKISEPIKMSGGDTIYIDGYSWADVPAAVFLDDNMQKISTYPVTNIFDGELVSETRHVSGPLVVPAGTVYMCMHDISNVANVHTAEMPDWQWYYNAVPKLKKIDPPVVSHDNKLTGKKYVACGDSFTSADNLGSEHYDSELKCYESYAWQIAKRNGMIYAPDAISGSTMAVRSDKDTKPFAKNRYKNIPEDVDYITLMFGLNELSVPIGDKNSSDITTTWGAWNTVLEWIITNRPKARIGIIIADAWMNQTHASALIDIANYWGVPYLDLGADPNVPLMNGGRRAGSGVTCSEKAATLRNKQHYQSYPGDAHPNYAGHVWRSTVIEQFIMGL